MIASTATKSIPAPKARVWDYKTSIKNHALEFRDRLVRGIISDSLKKGDIVVGVTHSERLGTSLRLNNIRCTTCTYNCIYCENGGPEILATARRECLSPYELFLVVQEKLEELKSAGIKIDYISFNPMSEPTIDIALWREIGLLRDLGIPIAVFTNASLMWNPLVQDSLHCADYLSVKLDSVNDETWRKIDRPHTSLSLDQILSSIAEFSKTFAGTFTTETMLVKGVNDTLAELEATGKFLRSMKRAHSYFMIPERTTGLMHAEVPDSAFLGLARDFIAQNIPSSDLVDSVVEPV